MQINLDPVAFYVFTFPIRWYALAYIAGIFLGAAIAKKVVKKLATFDCACIDQFINWAVIGIIVGGRLGHVVFYDLDFFLQNPIDILKVWTGGMSFHGGFIGVIVASVMFCRVHHIRLFDLFDALSVAAPVGLFFGRLANFVNGELYGTVWNSPWAFKFADNIPRHPSQLYEAFLEGIVLFLLELYICFFTNLSKKQGMLSGIFCIVYGAARCICEVFREPDSDANYQLLASYNITIGQSLSVPLIIAGLCIVIRAYKANSERA